MEKIFARKTISKTVDDLVAIEFVKKNHSQGAATTARKLVSIGLYFQEDLIAVAQFCSPRTAGMKRKYTTELLRLAFKKDTQIVGGASKLISYYKAKYNPADIFTYQDTTGEVTDVYSHCGFSLVKQGKKKEYLVAPGKTITTGNRKEVLGMAYATQYGPDRILGTKLGEIFLETGKRKSNRQIFLEDLGWHIEKTTGDRIYEWFNPDLTFYTYKITATDSDKYYYGVSHVKKGKATKEDCLTHRYFGTGGGSDQSNKFVAWKKKHANFLEKEVLKIFSSQAAAYEHEKELVNELWRTDKLCLNSTSGGKDGGLRPRKDRHNIQICNIHGESKHQGDSCNKCSITKSISIKKCPIHGEVKHKGDACFTCQVIKTIENNTCSIHGETIYRHGMCQKCKVAKNVTVRNCEIHGSTKFIGDQCYLCIPSGIALKNCNTHGLVLHRNDSCVSCSSEKSFSLKICLIHGEVVHKGNSCNTCSVQSVVTVDDCKIHGVTTFQGGKCPKCLASKLFSMQICSIHGESNFRKDKCIRCTNGEAQNLKECEIHGLVKHQKDRCCSCVAQKSKHTIWHVRKNRIDPTCSLCSDVRVIT